MNTLPFELTNTILNCHRCTLSKFRHNVVVGTGSIPAKILFLGEAPGKSENISGIPFFGVSGDFLREIIMDACIMGNIDRLPDYYITNTVLCRPCNSIGGQNRAPNNTEILMCAPLILEIVKNINPKLVIFVGEIAYNYYKREFKNHVKIFHPSFLLRKGGKGCVHYGTTIKILADALKEVSNVY
jgi:DNA polymerase